MYESPLDRTGILKALIYWANWSSRVQAQNLVCQKFVIKGVLQQ